MRVGGWYLPIAEFDGMPRGFGGAPESFRGVRVVHLMPTFKQCKDIHLKAVELELLARGSDWNFLGPKPDRTRWEIKFPGGSWLQWFGTKEADSARGLRCDIVTVDECDDIEPGVLDAIVRPWFSEEFSLRKILIGGTPRRGRFGLLYREYAAGLFGAEVRRQPLAAIQSQADVFRRDALRRRFSFHATYREAPGNVDQRYVAEQRAVMPPEVFKREWECDFDSAEGLVYSVFRGGYHVREVDPRIPFTEILIGVDHGYEDPGVFLVIGVQGQGRDAVLWLLEEVYETHKTTSWWVAKARELATRYPHSPNRPVRWYADPSQPATIEALNKEAGLGDRIVAGMNAIDDGVAAVADRIVVRMRDGEERCKVCDSIGCAACKAKKGFARFYVSPKCKETIREFGAYRRRRDPKDPERTTDSIEDRWNHAMDAVRYAIFSRFGAPTYGRTQSGAGWGR